MKKLLSVLLAALAVLILTPVAISQTRARWLRWIGRWLALPAQPGKAEAIVALGGPDGRLLYGIELFKQGWGKELWYTGDGPIPTIKGFTFGARALQIAREAGIPEGSVRLLASDSTWTDGTAIIAEVDRRGISSLLLVTDWYHSRRALGALQAQLAGRKVKVYYRPTPHLPYAPETWWHHEQGATNVVNELIKLVFYWRRYGLWPWQVRPSL